MPGKTKSRKSRVKVAHPMRSNHSTRARHQRMTRNQSVRSRLNNMRFTTPKTAFILITTHGNLDDTDDRILHEFDINVHKLNATTPGVCNWISDDDLVDMGEKINDFVKTNKTMGPSRLLNGLQKLLPEIDDMYKEDTKLDNKGKVQESDYFEEGFHDPDFTNYNNNKEKAYKIKQWKKGDIYLNKYYTSYIDEEYETNSNPFNNTITLLGTNGLTEMDIMKKSRPSLRKDKDIVKTDKSKNKKRFFLKDILQELNKDYTDVVIIDLSCSTGFGETAARSLRRTKSPIAYGGKIKKN